jgi:hypothetical protein
VAKDLQADCGFGVAQKGRDKVTGRRRHDTGEKARIVCQAGSGKGIVGLCPGENISSVALLWWEERFRQVDLTLKKCS